MKTNKYILTILSLLLTTLGSVSAQNYKANLPKEDKAATILLSYDNLIAGYLDSLITLEVVSNVDFTITPKANWIKVVKFENNYLHLKTAQNESDNSRLGEVEIAEAGGSFKRTLKITQSKNNAASFIKGDYKIKVSGGTATQNQPGEEIDKSFDGKFSTLYHSPYGNTTFPITLNYNFKDVERIDYLIYNPRQSGSNGNFDNIEVYYQTKGSTAFTLAGAYKLNGASSAYKVEFPGGLINPTVIRFVVKSGSGGYASCAEMEFYRNSSGVAAMMAIFDDAICSKLKPTVTNEQIDTMYNPFVKKLAKAIKSGTYNTEFRVNEFEAFPTISETANWMKTSGYNPYENPTGIYFEKDDEIVVFVDNPGAESISLLIKNQDPNESGSSTYFLKNGINKIVAANRGQSYLSYFSTNWKTAPNVKLHLAFGSVTGYYDLEKYKKTDGTYDLPTANSEFTRIIAGAKSTMFDVISKRHHACYPTQGFRTKNVGKGANFALAYDSIVYYSHEIMGLIKYNKEPKNRQFSRSVASGMFADGIGAGIPNLTSYSYMEAKDIDWWGIAHELGHVNQIRPNLKWLSTTEVTNNIYSSYVQHKLGNGAWIKSLGGNAYYRLEDESHGGSVDVMSGVGGRFNAYLNFGVKDGGKWLMQEGPDYYGTVPSGTPAGRNYDHFVKLAPLWQLTLYFKEAGVHPDFWAQMSEAARKAASSQSDGQYQINFMKAAIDSTGLNLAPFFEKVGMLREYNNYLVDYSSGTMVITKAQVDALKAHAAQYPAPASPVIYYICSRNYETYRDKAPLEVDYKEGYEGQQVKSTSYNASTKKLQVKLSEIRNVVAFETFDSSGNLSRITMKGFGVSSTANIINVLYPAGSSRIDAIGWDGTRKTIYNIPK